MRDAPAAALALSLHDNMQGGRPCQIVVAALAASSVVVTCSYSCQNARARSRLLADSPLVHPHRATWVATTAVGP